MSRSFVASAIVTCLAFPVSVFSQQPILRQDAFVGFFPTSAKELQSAIRGSKAVQRLYAKHYGSSSDQILSLADNLRQGRLKEGQIYSVYCYSAKRGYYVINKYLPKGTRVFELNDGTPVLLADCANPLQKKMPKITKAPVKIQPLAPEVLSPPEAVIPQNVTPQTEVQPPMAVASNVEAVPPAVPEMPEMVPFSPTLEQISLPPPLPGGTPFPWWVFGAVPAINNGGGGPPPPPPPIPEPATMSLVGLTGLLAMRFVRKR